MALKTLRLTKEEMNSRVARFQELKRFDGGLPDRENLESIRTLFNIIGFRPPKNHDPTSFPQAGESRQVLQPPLKHQKAPIWSIAKPNLAKGQ